MYMSYLEWCVDADRGQVCEAIEDPRAIYYIILHYILYIIYH
jgi:hypothetical protein